MKNDVLVKFFLILRVDNWFKIGYCLNTNVAYTQDNVGEMFEMVKFQSRLEDIEEELLELLTKWRLFNL